MNERVDVKEDRRDKLAEFANVPTPTKNNSIVPAQFGMPAERVFGAVDVAVHRDESRILQKLKHLAAAAGDDWFYRFPVKSKTGGKSFIEGPSIKLANDVARIYGNCDIDCRAQDLGDSWLFLARFTDFETGFTLTRPFQQRKNQRAIKTDDDRALDIAFQIGASKAIRNVVCNALQTFADYAFEESKNSLVQKIGSDIDRWRVRTIEGLSNIPVEVNRVELVIGRASKDWLAPDIARIIAMMKAIADGMATADETFPKPGAKDADETPSNEASEQDRGKLDEFAGKKDAETATDQKAEGGDKPAQEATQAATAQTATETKADDKKPASEAPKDAPLPKTEAEWRVYCTSWIENATDAAALTQRWKDEKTIRNKANVSEDAREEVKAKLDDKVKTLKAGG